MRETQRVLAPAGTLGLSMPNYSSIIEQGKRFIVKFPCRERLFPKTCFPADNIGRDEYHPYRYHKPVPGKKLNAMLQEAGFSVIGMRTMIFIWKNVPDPLFPLAMLFESILERIPLVRSLGSTLAVRAKKAS